MAAAAAHLGAARPPHAARRHQRKHHGGDGGVRADERRAGRVRARDPEDARRADSRERGDGL
eukprot:2625579-Prymnesium_polylepis.1